MRLRKKKTSAFVFLLIFSFIISSPLFCFSQDPKINTSPEAQQERQQETIHPAPANIKQQVGVLVFLGWLWLSILVLIYFLRLKIQEADRLYELEFYSQPKS